MGGSTRYIVAEWSVAHVRNKIRFSPITYLQMVTHWQPPPPHTYCCQQLACWATAKPIAKNVIDATSAFLNIMISFICDCFLTAKTLAIW